MLRNLKSLDGLSVVATDGEIGKADEFFFDHDHWTIRYLVVSTWGWLARKKVLVSPLAIGKAEWEARTLRLSLAKKQVASSPDINTDLPIARYHEIEYFRYYQWPYYWGGPYLWGKGPYPMSNPDFSSSTYGMRMYEDQDLQEIESTGSNGERHLKSTKEMKGYHIHSSTGSFGHLDDFIVEDDTWKIRYFVVDTSGWMPGKFVLISPEWVSSVHWSDRALYVDFAKDTIKGSPAYDPHSPITREYENRLHTYYDRTKYW